MWNQQARRVARHQSRRGVWSAWKPLTVSLAAASLVGGALTMPAGAAEGDVLPAQSFLDIAYTEPVPVNTRGNLLDVFLPERVEGEKIPLFIYTEGSAWFADTGKSSGAAWAERLNPHGYAVAGVSVRSSSQVQFPGQLHDIKAAIRYLRANADQYGIDPDRFALSGFSSGGWTAAIGGVTGDIGGDLEGTSGVTGVSSKVQAVIPFSPPTAFRLMDEQATEHSTLVHGVPNSPESAVTGCQSYPTGMMDERCTNAELANPVNYVSADDPPFLIFHGTHDPLLPPGQAQVLFDALAEKCVDATYHLLDGVAHTYGYLADPNPALVQTVSRSNPNTCETSVVEHSGDGVDVPSYALIVDFLDRVLGQPQPGPEPDPDTTQKIQVTVPEGAPGEFVWSIDGSNDLVDLGTAVENLDHYRATGSINPVTVTDTRRGGPAWSISAQVGDFTSGNESFSGKYLGWSPSIVQPGGGAVSGDPVPSGFDGGEGLSSSSTLGYAPDAHPRGSVRLGAYLDLKIPVEVSDGTYSATLTLTALS